MAVKVVLVTGFLGSGKTTLIKEILSWLREEKCALLINDFGQEGADSFLLSEWVNKNSKIYEISRGSIFCSCKVSQFIEKLQIIAQSDYEYLILETSGMSDPSGFEELLRRHGLEGPFDFLSRIAVFDAVRSYKLSKILPVVERQLRQADRIVINKTDLVDKAELEAITQFLEELNPAAGKIKSRFCHVEKEQIMSRYLGEKCENIGESCNQPGNRPGSLYLEQSGVSLLQFEKFYNQFKNDILRVKGFFLEEGLYYYLSDNAGKLELKVLEGEEIPFEGVTLIGDSELLNEASRIWSVKYKDSAKND